jgi:HJR/Mrr/RecB family endonuclease
MSGVEFEQFCKEVLVNYEWLVNTTKASGDHGIDIIARKNGKTAGIQCKNYANKMVNNRAIQEVYTGCHFYDLAIPVVVTNIGFTKQAIQEAKKLNIKLFDVEHFFCFASE